MWFDVSKEGLAKILERKGGKSFAIFELIQNAWDENTHTVIINIEEIGRGWARVVVIDDNPEGFKDLTHAFTLFAESTKKSDPTKRGRFNLGEKLVLAICRQAKIKSTKGTVVFSAEGNRRVVNSERMDTGSMFDGEMKMSKAEIEEVKNGVMRLIPPPCTRTTFNGVEIPSREPLVRFEATLPTEVSNEDGNLTRTQRKAIVEVFTPKQGEKATIYELGIPVVETDDKFHVNIWQKVPLNFDRDNVTPAYLRTIRTVVLNATYGLLEKDDTSATWVTEATSDERAEKAAVTEVIKQRFGEKTVALDPSDREANGIAMSKGYTVLSGRTLTAGQWQNAKLAGVVLPAGQVTPSPKPFSEYGRTLKTVSPDSYTQGMKAFVDYAKNIGKELLGTTISVVIANDFGWRYGGAFGRDGILTVNVATMGNAFFDKPISKEGSEDGMQRWDEFLIHEFAHYYESDHLSSEYHKTLCRLGAKMVRMMRNRKDI